MIKADRIETIQEREIKDETQYVLYIMDKAQRIRGNQALAFAVDLANKEEKKLIVVHFVNLEKSNVLRDRFYLEGLKEVSDALEEKGIKFLTFNQEYGKLEKKIKRRTGAIVTDKGYLKEDVKKRQRLYKNCEVSLFEVETSLVVPPKVATDKREYAARTIRPKLKKIYQGHLHLVKINNVNAKSLNAQVSGDFDVSLKTDNLLKKVGYKNEEVKKKPLFTGGYTQASSQLTSFIRSSLDSYAQERQNVLSDDGQSFLSAYLAFGQISPIEVISKVENARAANHKGRKAFVEELLTRRELAFNFVSFESNYDDFNCLPDWCVKTLDEHKSDKREPKYSKNEFDNAQTHDDLWNYCMMKIQKTGYLHNALRMYWGKKVLEWGSSPSYSYNILIELNNKYFLDGNDPNSYTNVLWCFGLHDRAWGERKIYGKVRSHSKKSAMKKIGKEEGLGKLQENL